MKEDMAVVVDVNYSCKTEPWKGIMDSFLKKRGLEM
jgi:hypothetical protein